MRRALVEAALHEFAAHGFDAASTRAIATRAGTHQPQINYHFESKLELWRASIDWLFERLDGLMSEAGTAASPSTRADFAAAIRGLVYAVARLPELNRIMVQEATVDSERLAWIVDRHTRRRYETLMVSWDDLRRAGDVPDIDALTAFYSLVGAASLVYVNAPEVRRVVGVDPIDDDFVRRHADAVVTMILGPTPTTA
ncbi:MAG: TetR/AcrR family transcriptional regulator [Acidimicrobiales bacterium]